jgi:hypothetical protein
LGSGLRARIASADGEEPAVETIRPLASVLFQRLRDVNDREGTASVFVYLPTEFDLQRDHPLLEMVRSLTAELGMAFVDLTPQLRALPAQRAARMFLPDGHYNVEGHRWVADALSVRLGDLPGVDWTEGEAHGDR